MPFNLNPAVKNEKKGKAIVDESVTLERALAKLASIFSHFMTAAGWEVLPPILRSKALAVGTTAKCLAPCLGGKPSQLPDLGLKRRRKVGGITRLRDTQLYLSLYNVFLRSGSGIQQNRAKT